MKKFLFAFVLLLPLCAGARTVKISKDELADKIKGAWAGQTIGCTFGYPTEFKYCGMMIPDSVAINWPEHYVKSCFEKVPGLYDDVYMDLTFVNVFAKEGLDAPVESFAKAFAYAGYPLWHANLAARANILEGLMPPASGHWKNNPHADDIDFQIEADYAGIMAPGMPNAAAFYSDAIGHMMNYGDGWYGGVYVAACYANAFIMNNIGDVVRESLKILPARSRYAACIADVIRFHEKNPSDWKAAWQMVQDKYTEEEDCPDEWESKFRIDAVVNGAYIVIGLLYGEEDFDRTMEISTRCGQDSDCNPASATGILGTMKGYKAIPEKYMVNLREAEDMDFAYTDISLNKVYGMSFDQALQVIERNGGKVRGDNVKIRIQGPVPVRYERSYEGVVKKELMHVDSHAFGQDVEFTFNGSGIVLGGRLRNRQGGDYEARTEIYIDGTLYKTVSVHEEQYHGHAEIFQAFDLENREHTVRVHVTNPRKDKQLWVARATVYVPEN